ncbi:hypothetical protein SDC9_14611 [bioreactor metagenome]|uniref:O-antigen biosynthesis glycosyltransferase WbnK n=1 Tax=bioreactor metagenome TaxID=1076179 RepID=A0A644TPG3_9ZZZZ|nr:alpha-1,2-fucosyltransferase [Clostridium sp.]
MIILGYRTGQLGNRLFVYAYFIANAMAHKYKVLNPSFDEYGRYFKYLSRNNIVGYPEGKWYPRKFMLFIFKVVFKFMHIVNKKQLGNRFLKFYYLEESKDCDLQSKEFLMLVKSTKFLVIQGWGYRDDKSFNKYADELREYFDIHDYHVNNIRILIADARKKGEILIGLHIRRGDYRYFQDGRYFYSDDEYRSVMKKIETLFFPQNVSWIICSNETIEDSFYDFSYTLGNNHLIEDMYTFSQCDYIVGAPSTYTAWASFYGKKPIYFIEEIEHVVSLDDFKVVGS